MFRPWLSGYCGLGAAHRLKHNGPAIKGGCVTWRGHRAASRYFRQITVTVQDRYGACFCNPGTNLIEHYECRGTSLLSGREFLPVQYFLNEHWSGRGTRITDLSYVQERFAKTVTNNLPLLSVL